MLTASFIDRADKNLLVELNLRHVPTCIAGLAFFTAVWLSAPHQIYRFMSLLSDLSPRDPK